MAEPVAERPAMTEYGVDTDAWQPLPWSWARERLERARNLWVVTATANGRPHALPVWGVWDDAVPGFSFSCAHTARKARNLAANPQVCVMPEDTVECVSVEGRATLLRDPEAIDAWIERYLAKYADEEVTADFLRENACYEVVPDRAFGVIERPDEFGTRATRWRWRH
jgi:hypothetical protein